MELHRNSCINLVLRWCDSHGLLFYAKCKISLTSLSKSSKRLWTTLHYIQMIFLGIIQKMKRAHKLIFLYHPHFRSFFALLFSTTVTFIECSKASNKLDFPTNATKKYTKLFSPIYISIPSQANPQQKKQLPSDILRQLFCLWKKCKL